MIQRGWPPPRADPRPIPPGLAETRPIDRSGGPGAAGRFRLAVEAAGWRHVLASNPPRQEDTAMSRTGSIASRATARFGIALVLLFGGLATPANADPLVCATITY